MTLLPAVIALQANGAEPSPISMLFPMVLIFFIFYFLLIRPQSKRQREKEKMIKAIQKGDNVVTTGGIHGRVTGVTDDVLTVEIAAVKGDRVRIKVDRPQIERVEKAKSAEASS